MNKRLLIDATHQEEVRVVIADEERIHEFDISSTAKTQNKGNIYLAKITRVEPSLQAAFVEYGGERQGFLPFSEIHPDYYQIPVADRKRLIEEVASGLAYDDSSAENANTPPAEPIGFGNPNDFAPSEDELAQLPESLLAPPPMPAATPESETVESGVLAESVPVISADAEIALPVEGDGTASTPSEARNGDDEDKDIETLEDDDEFMGRRKASYLRRYKIQEVIKRNQVILVQVVKEERGNKGASLSSYISLAGRYCVLMPNSPKTGGISRKISSGEDRKRLKKISDELRIEDGIPAIIRTAGIDRTRNEIKRDYDYLVKLWNQIRELTISSTAPAMVYEEADIIKRSLRDLYSSDIKEVVVAGADALSRARDFMQLIMPSHTARIKLHEEATPLFYAYDVEEQLLRIHEPVVKLDSGGTIVLSPTEALVSIDVNSGRSTTERNVEETALKTNLEAATEIARQLRLRDLAGLIVIDFIDMFDYRNRRAVEKQLKDALKNDRAKIQVGRISAFGLLEMSRQRLRPSLAETNHLPCPHCEGKGYVLSPDALGMQLVRLLEKEASTGEYGALRLKVSQQVAVYLLNTKRQRLLEIEQNHKIDLKVEIVETLPTSSSFILERTTLEGQKTEINGLEGLPSQSKRSRQRKRKRERVKKDPSDTSPDTAVDDADDADEVHEDENVGNRVEDAPAFPDDKQPGSEFRPRGDRPDRGERGGRRRRGGRNRGPRRDRGPRPFENRGEGQPVAAEGFVGTSPIEGQPSTPRTEHFSPNDAVGNIAGGEVRPEGDRPHRDRGERGRRRRGGRNRGPRRERGPRPDFGQAGQPGSDQPRDFGGQGHSSAPTSFPTSAPIEKAAASGGGGNSGGGDGEKKSEKRGWWRRIVE